MSPRPAYTVTPVAHIARQLSRRSQNQVVNATSLPLDNGVSLPLSKAFDKALI